MGLDASSQSTKPPRLMCPRRPAAQAGCEAIVYLVIAGRHGDDDRPRAPEIALPSTTAEFSSPPSAVEAAASGGVRLRAWQREALARFEACTTPSFLAVATPGAGKTTFALTAARRALM